jgi:hypothetical protein
MPYPLYEELGLQVCRGALNADLVFELVTFPTDFAERTRPLCQFMGRAWFGAGRPIAGMCANTTRLGMFYDHMRRTGGDADAATARSICAYRMPR